MPHDVRWLRPQDAGFVGRVIVDLHVSETVRIDGRFQLRSRAYSVKGREKGKGWRLRGHSPRLSMGPVTFSVSERLRRQVVAKRSKTPHAYMDGQVLQIIPQDDDAAHDAEMKAMRDLGGVHIAYDPYKVEQFVACNDEHLPRREECTTLPRLVGVKRLYAYERGVLAVLEDH